MLISNEGKRVIRFLIVGSGNALFGYVIYAIFIMLGAPYSVAILLAYIIGVAFSFFTTSSIVFQSFDWSKKYLFVMVYIISYFFSLVCIYIFIRYGFNSLVAGGASLPLVAALNYVCLNFLVFSK